MKQCSKCEESKAEDHFRRRGKKGKEAIRLRSYCKKCEHEMTMKEYWKIKEEVMSHYAEDGIVKCAGCGCEGLGKLCLHHVNGGGRQQLIDNGLVYTTKDGKVKVKTGAFFYRWLRSKGYPQDPPLQVLCDEGEDCHGKKTRQEAAARRKKRIDDAARGQTTVTESPGSNPEVELAKAG